jgi:hypothetical protein
MALGPGASSVLVTVVAFVTLFAVVAGYVVMAARRAEARLNKILRGEPLLLRSNGALFSGRQSQLVRLSGNGILALTATRLLFVMWAPQVVIELPLSHVVKARTDSSFRGRITTHLVVDFTDREDRKDACGWATGGTDTWVAKINSLAGKKP